MRTLSTALATTLATMLLAGCAMMDLDDPGEFQALSSEKTPGVEPDDIRIEGLHGFMLNTDWTAVSPRAAMAACATSTASPRARSAADVRRHRAVDLPGDFLGRGTLVIGHDRSSAMASPTKDMFKTALEGLGKAQTAAEKTSEGAKAAMDLGDIGVAIGGLLGMMQ